MRTVHGDSVHRPVCLARRVLSRPPSPGPSPLCRSRRWRQQPAHFSQAGAASNKSWRAPGALQPCFRGELPPVLPFSPSLPRGSRQNRAERAERPMEAPGRWLPEFGPPLRDRQKRSTGLDSGIATTSWKPFLAKQGQIRCAGRDSKVACTPPLARHRSVSPPKRAGDGCPSTPASDRGEAGLMRQPPPTLLRRQDLAVAIPRACQRAGERAP